jgi:hypothetical protein
MGPFPFALEVREPEISAPLRQFLKDFVSWYVFALDSLQGLKPLISAICQHVSSKVVPDFHMQDKLLLMTR